MGKGKRKQETILIDQAPDLESLPQLAAALAERFRSAQDETLVAVQAAAVSVPLLQLFCAAHRSAQQAGKTLRVDWKERRPVGDLLREAGFARHVACPRSQNGECLWLQEYWE